MPSFSKFSDKRAKARWVATSPEVQSELSTGDARLPQGKPLLAVRGLNREGLEPVTFDLMQGECLAVRGASGSGKSLLLRAIADLDPNRGTIRLAGQSREAMTGPDWRRQVCYLAAEPGWWAERAEEHFSSAEKINKWMEALLLSKELLKQPVSRLSTGERQRLALVRALEIRPRVLLLDEPTAALDETATRAVEEVIRRWLAEGHGALWASHDLPQLSRLGNRCLALTQGRVREESL